MDGNPNDVAGWRKLKHAMSVNRQLLPLKMTMLLYYGGILIKYITHLNKSTNLLTPTYSCVAILTVHDITDDSSRFEHRGNRHHLLGAAFRYICHASNSWSVINPSTCFISFKIITIIVPMNFFSFF